MTDQITLSAARNADVAKMLDIAVSELLDENKLALLAQTQMCEMFERGAVHTVLIETPTSGSHTCD